MARSRGIVEVVASCKTVAGLPIVMALSATPVASLLNVLPKTYILAIAGLAIVTARQDALVSLGSTSLTQRGC
jgi:predicted benzoate:H+ symporter BenE